MGKKHITYFAFFSSLLLISCMSGRVGYKQDLLTDSITALSSADSEDMWKAKIKWERIKNMVVYEDTTAVMPDLQNVKGCPDFQSKKIKINDRSFFFCSFDYAFGLPRWRITILEQVGEQWKLVAKGDIVRAVHAITVDYDPVNNKLEFWTLMAESSNKIDDSKSLKRLENIGSLLIDDL